MKTTDIIRLISLSAIWGASFLFMRIIVPTLGAIPAAFFRVLFAAAGLAVILLFMRIRWDFKNKLGTAMFLGVINSGIPFVMFSLAAKLLPAGYSAILNATTPLMGVIIGALFFSEKPGLNKVLGVCTGIAGVAVLTSTGPLQFNAALLVAAAECMVATSCYGLASFLTRKWITAKGGLDSKLVAFGSQLGAVALLLPFFSYGMLTQPPASWGDGTLWLTLAALGLICTALAYILYFRLIADIGPVKSLTVTFLIPPFGVLWGVLFLKESITLAHLMGGSLIALAVWLVLRPQATATT
ncbi:transporter [Undibacterium sp. YM2]|uniref:DMT family transporter n=1 Tax=Undibacterium sp. YM2 TaxID=2058625 RepID=UPI001331F33F|nr:DMT family transporter [Undibacterium sp. YM2]BBB68950.1 transporter [Undibacterium sp. YM2]